MAFLVLGLTACDKSETGWEGKSFPEKLTGKWNYSQRYYSPGGGMIYESTEHLHQWIDFKPDGSFSSNMPGFQDVASYEILDSVKVRLNRPGPQSSERFFVRIEDHAQTLTLSSADHICIEGCGSKFKRD